MSRMLPARLSEARRGAKTRKGYIDVCSMALKTRKEVMVYSSCSWSIAWDGAGDDSIGVGTVDWEKTEAKVGCKVELRRPEFQGAR